VVFIIATGILHIRSLIPVLYFTFWVSSVLSRPLSAESDRFIVRPNADPRCNKGYRNLCLEVKILN